VPGIHKNLPKELPVNTFTARSIALTSALIATVGLAACSGDDTATPDEKKPLPAVTYTKPVMAGLVGPKCAEYDTATPAGKASFDGMSNVPLVTAAKNNPMLTRLAAAVTGKVNKKVILDETLNGGEWTFFAPVDEAFGKLPAATTAKFTSDSQALLDTLIYHVVTGRIEPKQLVGSQRSVQGGDLKVTEAGGVMKVNGAQVLCGGIRTANATVYLIDQVLTPPK
jgi:uncharacterized surface protein with fasciclin (FAS1) repeats